MTNHVDLVGAASLKFEPIMLTCSAHENLNLGFFSAKNMKLEWKIKKNFVPPLCQPCKKVEPTLHQPF